MTAGGSIALYEYSNQEDAVWGKGTDPQTASTDSDLAVCVTLKDALPGQAAEGKMCCTTFGKSLSVCVDKEH